MDRDPSNSDEDNLAFLCLDHHTVYDSKASQHKNYTAVEVKAWRDQMYANLEQARIAVSAQIMASPVQGIAALQRTRDIDTLRSTFSLIHWPTLDEHVSELPYAMTEPIFHFFEGFHAMYTGSLFHLYDPVLAREIGALHSAWEVTVSYGVHYRHIPSGKYVFDNPNHRPFSPRQERDWKKIQQATTALSSAKRSLLSHIRAQYVEIDVNQLSSAAWKAFVEYRSRPLD